MNCPSCIRCFKHFKFPLSVVSVQFCKGVWRWSKTLSFTNSGYLTFLEFEPLLLVMIHKKKIIALILLQHHTFVHVQGTWAMEVRNLRTDEICCFIELHWGGVMTDNDTFDSHVLNHVCWHRNHSELNSNTNDKLTHCLSAIFIPPILPRGTSEYHIHIHFARQERA